MCVSSLFSLSVCVAGDSHDVGGVLQSGEVLPQILWPPWSGRTPSYAIKICGNPLSLSPSFFTQRFCLLSQGWVEAFDGLFQEQVCAYTCIYALHISFLIHYFMPSVHVFCAYTIVQKNPLWQLSIMYRQSFLVEYNLCL